uniref:Uncharacterized protein n=1 Tax=Ditylenchus dipsaci TaxID=166011 RepID=A0A915EE02_9BILA
MYAHPSYSLASSHPLFCASQPLFLWLFLYTHTCVCMTLTIVAGNSSPPQPTPTTSNRRGEEEKNSRNFARRARPIVNSLSFYPSIPPIPSFRLDYDPNSTGATTASGGSHLH